MGRGSRDACGNGRYMRRRTGKRHKQIDRKERNGRQFGDRGDWKQTPGERPIQFVGRNFATHAQRASDGQEQQCKKHEPFAEEHVHAAEGR